VTPLVECTGIDKSFFGVRVLKDVHLAVPAGRTVGLVGENGAGKSTLMNVLGGNLRPDAGRMTLAGEPYAPASPRDAEAHGIAFIHQELNLFANLSIAENICLTGFPRRGPLIDRRASNRHAAALIRQVGLDLSPDVLVERLSAGERQLVEIARALGTDARLIILDEPTTSLTGRERARLFDLLGRLRERGIAMIYISHALGDVLRLCDEIAVLRDGMVVGAGPRTAFDVDRMIALMVGRSLDQLFPPRRSSPQEDVVLTAGGVTQPNVVKDVSFALHRGEVLGVSGLMGSGRTELARILFGLDPMARGDVRLAGESIRALPPRERIRRGLAFLTEDRRTEGIARDASIADNITLVSARAHARGPFGWLDARTLHAEVDAARHAVRLTPTADLSRPVRTLSGGNQQKVVLAKWLLARPKALILDEPTRGIDVGARYEIYTLIDDLAAGGAGVLLISSDLEELLGICDRILVMSRGQITDELQRSQFDRERVLRAAFDAGRLQV
jgi:ribose transport system ATP-binding protein